MFKFVESPRFTHTIKVMVPIDGGYTPQTMDVTYQVLMADKDDDRFDLNTTDGSSAFLREVVIAVSDVVGADDTPLPYSDSLRDQLLKLPYVRAAMARGYFRAITDSAMLN